MRAQNGTILLVKSQKLDPMPFHKNLKPTQANLRWHLHGIILKGNSIGFNQKMKLRKEFMVWM
jgi:hypothetical protein